jgi:hypothetical protein
MTNEKCSRELDSGSGKDMKISFVVFVIIELYFKC